MHAHRRSDSFRCPRGIVVVVLLLSAILVSQPALAAAPRHVIQISVDGLGSAYLQPMVEAQELPSFKRLQTEGAWTYNARDDYDVTVTLPNHVAMVTARGIVGEKGHGWTSNSGPKAGQTIHSRKGSYVSSVFDVAHDHGLRTGLFVSKSKLALITTSYNADNGAADTVEPDNGRNKIDTFIAKKDTKSLVQAFIAAMREKPCDYAFVHFIDPDAAGHPGGWGGKAYKGALKTIDAQLGEILRFVESDATLKGTTTIIVTADHGGSDRGHGNAKDTKTFTVPFYVWGPGVPAGKDLYSLNPTTRLDPGKDRAPYSAAVQPIRHADGTNLALKLLGLSPIPGSTINSRQDLCIETTLKVKTTVPLSR